MLLSKEINYREREKQAQLLGDQIDVTAAAYMARKTDGYSISFPLRISYLQYRYQE